ncbi:MAG: ATP-binding cassette domain-containing protein [Candidatus Caenarcaniphilales bacterium]|nr:ATP-binding cassette domain-containing protein [Candidatus Caenarcaniphilales bacterium]
MIDRELILSAKSLHKEYSGHIALRGVSLDLRRGQICSLVGQNGAGKSTLLRIMTGIFYPDTGSIEYFGKSQIGYLPEERGLYRKMKVLEHLIFLGELKGLDPKKACAYSLNILERLSLADWAESEVQSLSKGMQQKVQIIGTILHQPELLIIDEPFSGLDPISLDQVTGLLLDLKKAGTAIFLATHETPIAESISDLILILHKGSTLWFGDIDRLHTAFGASLYHFELELEVGKANFDMLRGFEGLSGFKILESRLSRKQGYEILVCEASLENDKELENLIGVLLRNYHLRSFRHYTPVLDEVFRRLVMETEQNQIKEILYV